MPTFLSFPSFPNLSSPIPSYIHYCLKIAKKICMIHLATIFTHISDESSTTDVSVSSEAEGDLPGELTMTSVPANGDARCAALLAALLKCRGGDNQKQDQAQSRLHSDFNLVF